MSRQPQPEPGRQAEARAADNETLSLRGVQETLLTPLCARADQYGRPDAIVVDRRAAEIVASLDYDFDRIRRFPDTLTGCAIRAAVFDQWIAEFLATSEDAAVVLIGEGLDTTVDRNDDDRTLWFELDFPDVIELRRRFFPATERRVPLAGSVFDSGWVETVRASGRSRFLFQAAGLTMYLPPPQVRQLFETLADHFPGCTFLFDTCSTLAKRKSAQWEATVRTTDAVYRWGIDDARAVRQWDERFRVTDVRYMLDYHRHQWSVKTRFWSALWPSLRRAYQLNRAVLAADR